MRLHRTTALVAAPLVALALGACTAPATTITTTQAPSSQAPTAWPASNSPASAASSKPATTVTTSAPPPAASKVSPTGTCSQNNKAAFEANVGKIPASSTQQPWQMVDSQTPTFDSCKALSYIIVIAGATASSPHHIMLFHNGEYVGTATAKSYGFTPQIDNRTNTSITVTYKYPRNGESNAQASGRATATFTWDEAQQKVVMTGEVPPLG